MQEQAASKGTLAEDSSNNTPTPLAPVSQLDNTHYGCLERNSIMPV
jgi:hypothetical protein